MKLLATVAHVPHHHTHLLEIEKLTPIILACIAVSDHTLCREVKKLYLHHIYLLAKYTFLKHTVPDYVLENWCIDRRFNVNRKSQNILKNDLKY